MTASPAASTRVDTIAGVLAAHEAASPALGAPGREPLSFGGLREQIERTTAALNGFGLGRGDPIAIVLPNGAGDGGGVPRGRLGGDGRAAQSGLSGGRVQLLPLGP